MSIWFHHFCKIIFGTFCLYIQVPQFVKSFFSWHLRLAVTMINQGKDQFKQNFYISIFIRTLKRNIIQLWNFCGKYGLRRARLGFSNNIKTALKSFVIATVTFWYADLLQLLSYFHFHIHGYKCLRIHPNFHFRQKLNNP